MDIRKARALLGAGVLIAAGLAAVATPTANATPSSSSASYKIAGHAAVTVTSDSWCDNKGPHITLSTTASLAEANMQIQFSNNSKLTHHLEVVGTATLQITENGNGVAQIAKQPSLGGVGGNPWIYIDMPGETGPQFLGRCVQDGKIGNLGGSWASDFDVNAFTSTTVQALECSNKGSKVQVGTSTTTGDVTGQIIFANNDYGKTPPHINDSDIGAAWTFTLANGGTFRKGWGVGGAGGNPLVGTDLGTVGEFGVFTPTAGTHVDHGKCNKLT